MGIEVNENATDDSNAKLIFTTYHIKKEGQSRINMTMIGNTHYATNSAFNKVQFDNFTQAKPFVFVKENAFSPKNVSHDFSNGSQRSYSDLITIIQFVYPFLGFYQIISQRQARVKMYYESSGTSESIFILSQSIVPTIETIVFYAGSGYILLWHQCPI
uniref:Transmembrane protein n=1 Tax=Rhabditophanes sp. KR3021 TaxID=114890 RepID=A0AC35TXH7_9BILA